MPRTSDSDPGPADARGRRALIVEHSARMFAEKGIHATTVREIGDAAGVYPGSLYHWFGSKDDIVRAILGEFMESILGRFDAVEAATDDPVTRIEGFISATLGVIDDFPEATAIYQNGRQYLRDHDLLDEVAIPSRGVREHWLRAIDLGISSGRFRNDIPREAFYRSVRDTLWATMHWPARHEHTTEGFAAVMSRLFLHGFLAPAG